MPDNNLQQQASNMCIDGKPHNWVYKHRVDQHSHNRGYYKDFYYCSKCLKEIFEAAYYDEMR